jgi:hypothetical protein
MKKCSLHEWAGTRLKDDLQKGYLYIPVILERYEYYDNHRTRYAAFDDFYPTLLDVFKERPDPKQ